MQSEKSCSQKGTYSVVPFIQHFGNKIREMENRLTVVRGYEMGTGRRWL